MGSDGQAIAADQIAMKDPATKMELLQAITGARGEWDDLIKEIPQQRFSEPVASGLTNQN